MRTFFAALRDANPPSAEGRRFVYVPYDQLTDAVGLLSGDPDGLGIVLVESAHKAGRRPYHQQKLALILANMRHFALEQAARGVFVDYRAGERLVVEVAASAAPARNNRYGRPFVSSASPAKTPPAVIRPRLRNAAPSASSRIEIAVSAANGPSNSAYGT